MGEPPKTRGKGYVPLSQVFYSSEGITVNKCKVQIISNKLFVDGREINEFAILKDSNFILIKGEHYTSRENANEVRNIRSFIVPPNDNYVYFLESGFYNLSEDEIRHTSGAAKAEVKFEVKFSLNIERVWIKVEKQHPVKFAIEGGLDSEEIIEISIERV